MQRSPVISWKNLDPAPAVEARIHERIAALERFFPNLIGCRVVVCAPQRRKVSGREIDVRIHLEVPGPDIDIARSIHQGQAGDDALLAVNAAFAALEQRLKEYHRRLDGKEVKHHPPLLHGEIVEFEPELGWGFLRADDGREVYFQKDALGEGAWETLALGDRLRFREMEGEKGPFAVDVTVV
ncbi:HPF/RaiA family ribosome-associated protein [Acidimangrovimonas pyrenivorans]|uniref:HPF/RaiA family ribosome-associated protein n=1 Tax=Acidimangrovimonas pyrenivorans TaxID=2030798 RepID=A0ABV7AH87_9RHOB